MIENVIEVRVRSTPPSVASLAAARSALPKIIKTDMKKRKKDSSGLWVETNNAAQYSCKKRKVFGNKATTWICNLCHEKGIYVGLYNPDSSECTCDGFEEHVREVHPVHANSVYDIHNNVSH